MREGEFLHPGDGVTAYVREIMPDGELEGLFLQDRRDPGLRTTYTAERAYLVPSAAGGGPILVMIEGMAQTLDVETRNLIVTTFADFAYDLGRLAGTAATRRPDARELGTRALLTAGPGALALTGASAAELRYEGHVRLADPLLAAALPPMALGFMLMGGFSRLGLWRQVAATAAAAVLLELSGNAVENAVRSGAAPIAATYAPAALAASAAAALLWRDTFGSALMRRAFWPGRRGGAAA